MSVSKNLDELIESVTLYAERKFIFHFYVLPFIIIYSNWLYLWLGIYGFWEHYEGGFLGLAAIGCTQILCGLACYWSVHVKCFFTCSKQYDYNKATVAKVIPTKNNGSSQLVRLHKSNDEGKVYFLFQKTKYLWDSNKKTFRALEFPIHQTFKEYLSCKGYQDEREISNKKDLYGLNKLDMDVPEFMELFQERAAAPFFVFQVFCVGLWCLDKYWYYSIFTLVMLVLFECTLVQQQLRNMAEIRKMGNKPYNIQVYRNRKWRSILTTELIPGDIISIVRSHKDNLVPCDILLLRGSCIVDESLLTGESVPQMKESIENYDLDRELDPDSDGKLHVIFGGTKVVQHNSPNKNTNNLRPNDNGCLAYVLRTGFNTCQGKLLRTILYGVKRVTANNKETFGFIIFLLIFALAAAIYVWIKGCEDPDRNRYKLFLECTLILTSVIPPELPIELSLAVNTSLLALTKFSVFCTEPFRIPFAGKIDVCCFDKTGTLTSDNLIVEGIALSNEKTATIIPLQEAPVNSIQVLATCHSLVQLDDGLIGDPLEKTTLMAIDWNLTKGDTVIPKRGKYNSLKIFHRFHFSSNLKRMSVVAGYNPIGSSETTYIGTIKGAPETLKSMFDKLPDNYNQVYLELARKGVRVLALGWKEIGHLTTQQLREITREEIEKNLKFVGFVAISCPLKNDSKYAISELQNSSHLIVMITGDNPLTACYVAQKLFITTKKILLLDKNIWKSIDETEQLPINIDNWRLLIKNYDLCITGDMINYLEKNYKQYLFILLPYIKVFARVAPKQKEFIIVELKHLGYTTLMCGDGTNDVGALKHADVGVAILTNSFEKIQNNKKKELKNRSTQQHTNNNRDTLQMNLNKMMKDLDEPQIVKLGDASIASPFTSKLSSILCICHIIKQGRCTLVTTLQMFKILALNALILAYTQSVLYLDGIKLRDMQATLQGLLLAACFLFISRSTPLKTLSRKRPLPNIFNLYTIMTVLLQFTVHFCCLIFLVREAKLRMPLVENEENVKKILTEEEEDQLFEPNILNSTVYIISMALQIATFAINYRGHPFMESLKQNKALLYSILGSGMIVLALVLGIFPKLSATFEIIEFPFEFRIILIQILLADFFFSFLFDRICLWLFENGTSIK